MKNPYLYNHYITRYRSQDDLHWLSHRPQRGFEPPLEHRIRKKMSVVCTVYATCGLRRMRIRESREEFQSPSLQARSNRSVAASIQLQSAVVIPAMATSAIANDRDRALSPLAHRVPSSYDFHLLRIRSSRRSTSRSVDSIRWAISRLIPFQPPEGDLAELRVGPGGEPMLQSLVEQGGFGGPRVGGLQLLQKLGGRAGLIALRQGLLA